MMFSCWPQTTAIIFCVFWMNVVLFCSVVLASTLSATSYHQCFNTRVIVWLECTEQTQTYSLRPNCFSVCFFSVCIICFYWQWEHSQMNLIFLSCVQVTPSCVTGGAWEWFCLRCWWDSHPFSLLHPLRLRSRSVKKKNIPCLTKKTLLLHLCRSYCRFVCVCACTSQPRKYQKKSL